MRRFRRVCQFNFSSLQIVIVYANNCSNIRKKHARNSLKETDNDENDLDIYYIYGHLSRAENSRNGLEFKILRYSLKRSSYIVWCIQVYVYACHHSSYYYNSHCAVFLCPKDNIFYFRERIGTSYLIHFVGFAEFIGDVNVNNILETSK